MLSWAGKAFTRDNAVVYLAASSVTEEEKVLQHFQLFVVQSLPTLKFNEKYEFRDKNVK